MDIRKPIDVLELTQTLDEDYGAGPGTPVLVLTEDGSTFEVVGIAIDNSTNTVWLNARPKQVPEVRAITEAGVRDVAERRGDARWLPSDHVGPPTFGAQWLYAGGRWFAAETPHGRDLRVFDREGRRDRQNHETG
jgi:hypothetical protein